jgi:TonB family protein
MLQHFLLAIAVQAVPAPAVATVNGWGIFDGRGSCSATGSYDGDVFVHLSYDYGRDSVFFSVTNPAWESIQSGTGYTVTVRFNNGSTYDDVRATGMRSDNAGGRLIGIGMRMSGNAFLSDFAGAGALAITMGTVRVDSIRLNGTRAVVQRLIRCSIESHRRYPPDPFAGAGTAPPASTGPGPIRPQRARANFNSYFSTDDYPAAALRGNDQGTTGFSLTIGPNGRVTACNVTSSSGSSALDQATCRILRSRARYTPARDSSGNPTSGSDSGRITWRLPTDNALAGPSLSSDFDNVATVVGSLPPEEENAGRPALLQPALASARPAGTAALPASPSRVWVQIATGPTRPGLVYQYGAFRRQAPALLGGRAAYTAQLNATNRLLVGPFASESAARAFVVQLSQSGVQAYTWTSEAGQEIEPLAP